MVTNNTGAVGEIDIDKFQPAILEYRYCPDQDTKLSPAMIIFGRPVKDFIPILPEKYSPHYISTKTCENREIVPAKRHL